MDDNEELAGDALDADEDDDLSDDLMEEEEEEETATNPESHDWEAILAAEMGIDQSTHAIIHSKSSHAPSQLNVEQVFTEFKGTPEDRRRHAAFLEDTLAAYHMKDLTSKYGSKGKTAKQYFMEAYDDDTRLEGVLDEDKVHHYDIKGREIKLRQHKALLNKNQNVANPDKKLECPPIVISSVDPLLLEEGDENDLTKNGRPTLMDEPEYNFWASLDKLQRLNETDSQLSWCLNGTVVPPDGKKLLEIQMLEDREDVDSLAPYYDFNDAYLDKYLSPVQEVCQSRAVRRAWARAQKHLQEFNIKDPQAYDMYGNVYEETRDFVKLPEDDVQEFEAGNWEPIPINEDAIFEMEPPEKLMGRFSVYQKALLYMIEHFETLRPLLSEIKQAYHEVFDKCEKDWKELDKFRIEQLRLKDSYAAHVRQKDKDGDRALMEVNLQIHALQEHLQWQQHTLHTILGVLSKMRHSLKMQNKAVQLTTSTYKNKVELLAKETVNSQGQPMYEASLPGKYTEIMAKFRNVEGKELRRILNVARRRLRKAHQQILNCEDYQEPEIEIPPKKEKPPPEPTPTAGGTAEASETLKLKGKNSKKKTKKGKGKKAGKAKSKASKPPKKAAKKAKSKSKKKK